MENPNDHTPEPETGKATEPVIKQGWLRALIFILVYPIFLVFQSILMLAFTGFNIESVDDFVAAFDEPIMIPAMVVSLLVTILYIWLFRRFIDRRSLVSLGLSFRSRIRKDFVMGIVWGGGMAAAVFGLLWMFGMAHIQSIHFPVGSLIIVAVTMTMASAQEELLLRGYMLNNLMQSANKYLSLVLVSVIFSVGHGLNPNLTVAGLVNIVLAGLVLGIYYVHRGNLWFPIGLHVAWNWFQGAVFGSPVSGIQVQSILVVQFTGNEDLTGGGFGFEGSLMMTVVSILAIIMIHLIYRRPEGDSSGIPAMAQPGEK